MPSLQARGGKNNFTKSFCSSGFFYSLREKVIFAGTISKFSFLRFGPFFTEPVIAGLDEKEKNPFICSMDLIGCINFAKDFVVAGTASANLYGICESLYEPDLVSSKIKDFFVTFYLGTR